MIKSFAIAAAVVCCCLAASNAGWAAEFKTPYYSLTVAPDGASVEALSVDSLGHGEFRPSGLFPPEPKTVEPGLHAAASGWRFKSSPKSFKMESVYHKGVTGTAVTLKFDTTRVHATLLALVDGGQARLPAVLHLPGQGSLRIEVAGKQPVRLGYDAHRKGKGYVEVRFPCATAENPRIVYSLTVVAIYPNIPAIRGDARFDGFRRNYLNIFQVQAENGVLANNSASDPCAFVVHMNTAVAKYAPPLAKGLTVMDLVRMSLDKYLAGFLGYGMPGYRYFDYPNSDISAFKAVFLDVYPSLLVGASDYVTATNDRQWLSKNYQGLRRWTEAMLATDTNGNGLVKYPASGNSGSWIPRPDGKIAMRPANWWDTIGFGHEDAYSNALAYHALEGMVTLAHMNREEGDAERYRQRAEKLKDAYLAAFLDPTAGVLGGWRSQDGKRHNYYFPWVNGAAVAYGLVPAEVGNSIYDALLAKMKEVGYSNFELGLPGNLIPVRREDYVDLNPRFGGPRKEDGSDGFQIYENGGATASFTYYSLAALYKLGRVEDGDRLLFPMLKSFTNGSFEGRGANGMSNDWKAWDGTPNGYEGFLSDNFMALAAVVERAKAVPSTQSGR